MDRSLTGHPLQLIIAYRDKHCRFGIETIRYTVEQNAGELAVLDETIHSTTEKLTDDLLSALHVLNRRVLGRRPFRSSTTVVKAHIGKH